MTAFFAPFSNLDRIDVDVMSQARRSIDMAADELPNEAILNALGEAARRSVRIRLYLSETELRRLTLSPEHPLVRLATTSQAEIRAKPDAGDPMRWRAYIVDSRLVRTGSASLSRSGLNRQDADLVLITAPDVVRAYEGAFAILWDRGVNRPLPLR